MKINIKELKNGDVFKIQDDNKTYKVMEVSEIPLYSVLGEVVYPIMCDCFSPEHGKTCGYMKLSDGVKEVELLYRENENKYESWTSAIFKEGGRKKMKVKFKKLRENAKLPTKAHDDDFCYDVYACDCEEVAPNVYRYPLGFALQIDENEGISLPDNNMSMFASVWQNHKTILSIDFRPRSSIYKTGMVLCNSVGTGDISYTGEYWAYFYHVMPNMPKYEPGDRIAQMKIGFTVPIEFVEVEELDDTERGDGGFGSSGLK